MCVKESSIDGRSQLEMDCSSNDRGDYTMMMSNTTSKYVSIAAEVMAVGVAAFSIGSWFFSTLGELLEPPEGKKKKKKKKKMMTMRARERPGEYIVRDDFEMKPATAKYFQELRSDKKKHKFSGV